MDMPTPAAGHRKFEQLAGRWEGTETMHPSDWDPKGGTAHGTTINRIALNGFALITDYEQTREGAVTFAGHGVYTYDAGADRYTLHWLDSIGSPMEVFTGGFDGEILSLGHGGPGMHARLRWDLGEPGQMGWSMQMSPDGKRWNKLFDALYRRVA